MELIHFLKYGAIGIALALAVLSFRLLSKEQEQTRMRPTMLRLIRNYLRVTIFLSVFFGLLELATLFFLHKDQEKQLHEIWKKYCGQYADSTNLQKKARLINLLELSQTRVDTNEICCEVMENLEQCHQELQTFDVGFYQNIIKLRSVLNNAPDNWLDIAIELKNKRNVMQYLRAIFYSLGCNSDEMSDEEVIQEWKDMKRGWSKKKLTCIYHTDINELVKRFLKNYE
jgi:hypothetical protein